jgi:predicted GIY-YIG superfamily endonuclease
LYALESVPTGKQCLHEHTAKNAGWTSAYKPSRLVATEEYPDRAAASRLERFLKGREGIAARKKLIEGIYGEGKI